MNEVVIVEAVRTPIGRHGGALKDVRPDDLAALTLRALAERARLDPAQVEEVILGCANQAGEDNRNVARMAVLLAGWPVEVPAVTVNRLCASGLTAIITAYRAIRAGEGDIYIAGGVESMTRAPYAIPKTSPEWAFGNLTAWDTTLGWRFPNPRMKELHGLDAMGETAENVAELFRQQGRDIDRAAQDAFALQSQQRAAAAMNAGRFDDEIIPVPVPQKKGDPVLVRRDEHPRPDTSLEGLARLKPAFRPGGTVTAGNASGLNDGAAAVLLMRAETAQALGYRPLARILSAASAGVAPRLMGLGPVPATRKALHRAGLTLADMDLVELNEAFAVQALAVMADLGLDPARTNVNGGAIALGHPLGASGARLLTTLLHELRRRATSANRPLRGLATLCVGVGQGETLIVETL